MNAQGPYEVDMPSIPILFPGDEIVMRRRQRSRSWAPRPAARPRSWAPWFTGRGGFAAGIVGQGHLTRRLEA